MKRTPRIRETNRRQQTRTPVQSLVFYSSILPFALKTLQQLSLRVSSERLTVDRVTLHHTYETIICWWSAFTMPGRGHEESSIPILGRLSPPIYFSSGAAARSSTSSSSSSWWERTCLEDTRRAENEIFSSAVTLSLSLLLHAVFYPPSRSLPPPRLAPFAPHAPLTCEIHRATQSLRRLARYLRLSPAGRALLLFPVICCSSVSVALEPSNLTRFTSPSQISA